MLIKGKVNFVQKSEHVKDRYDVTFSVRETSPEEQNQSIQWLNDCGISVKDYKNPKTGVTEQQVRCTMFDNCNILYIENGNRVSKKFSELPLIYGDICTFKCHIGDYHYKNKTGKALRVTAVALLKAAQRSGFTDEEMEEVFK